MPLIRRRNKTAKETDGGTWIDVNSNDKKGHVNIYDSDPRGPHDQSIHINIDYDKGTFSINEKSDGEKTSTDCRCYLTTACMRNLRENFDDNCYELTVLRWFRDNFVSNEDIEHYYKVAPIIVETIENENEISAKSIYNYIYNNVVSYCVTQIEQKNYSEAYARYKDSVLILEEHVARPSLEKRLVKVLKQKHK